MAMVFDTVKCRHCQVVYKARESHKHICKGKKNAWHELLDNLKDTQMKDTPKLF